MSLVVLRFVGRFGEDEVRLTLVILPGVLLGLLASRWTSVWSTEAIRVASC